jgi:excisionase family DNA binding protein
MTGEADMAKQGRKAALKRSTAPTPPKRSTPPAPPKLPNLSKEKLRALVEQVTVPVEIAGELLGIGRSLAYEAIKNKELPAIKIGNRLSVPTAPLRAMLHIEK